VLAWLRDRRSHVRFTPKADIVHGGGNVRFVPILLQKSVEALPGQ
jgi:hypothetical protein